MPGEVLRYGEQGVKVYNSVEYSYSMVEVGYATFGVAATAGGIVEGGLKYIAKAPNDPTFPYFSSHVYYQVSSDYSNAFFWPNVDKYIFNNK